ncbi:putative reverse transcriptase domain-containing protein, partial [Tanacetum coccineum]
ETSIRGISLRKLSSKGTIHHPKPLSSLKKSITLSRKVMKHYTKPGNGTVNRQLLDSQGPIPGMTSAQALTAIQTMADHSQKWHDGSSSRNIDNSSNSEGIVAIVSKLDSLGQDMKKLKENVHAIQVGCQTCGGAHLNKECPLNEEVKIVEEVNIHVDQEEGVSSRVLPYQLPPKELNLGNFILPCTIGSLNFYDMADLGASVNVIPKSMFEYLKLARLMTADMLVEIADMMKRAPIGIVENVLVKIDKFLFPSDFVVIDMLNACNETMILKRPFLATIHAEIDVFNKEISVGIRDDRVTFYMDQKIYNFTIPVGKVYMINLIHNNKPSTSSNALTDKSSHFEKCDNLHNENSYDNYMQEQSRKKIRMLKSNTNIPSVHFCKHVKKICSEILKVWPTCDPTMKGDNTYWWHDHGLEENERQENSLDMEEYAPPKVLVETFKVKGYSFDSGQGFICVSKEKGDTLPLGRENESRV